MEFPRFRGLEKVIIAMKGLPCTFKTEMASLIGKWATCRVFYIDDFLSPTSLEKGYSRLLMPSEEEEAERLRRLAFESLCKSALRYLKCPEQCVVIKSRLGSTFELDCLLRLSASVHDLGQVTVIIIDCHAKNEHRLCARLELEAADIPEHEKEWYKAWSRLDFEKARDDWLISKPDWDRHLSDYLINADERQRPRRVTRLVLDPAEDLNFSHERVDIHPAFKKAITYLLTRHLISGAREEVGWIGEEIVRDRYEEVSYHKLRRYQQEMGFRRAAIYGQKKRKYLCATELGKRCVFNTCTEGGGNDVDNCGVCDEQVLVSAGYACLYCFLTLHKSCAELQGVNSIGFAHNNDFLLDEYPKYDEDQDHTPPPWKLYACKSCTEEGKVFSVNCNACLYQTHLKGGMFPTIINHDSHKEHPLFWGSTGRFTFTCKACGRSSSYRCSYACFYCMFGYCMRCVSWHGKVEHKHGGHHHAMKLLYTRDEMVLKEDYWCGVCYEDMDPQHWFYSCLDCPSYEAHPRCIEPVRKSEETREQDHIN